ncbi:hypothetical protein H5410_041034, partial [Solanum commersonii]
MSTSIMKIIPLLIIWKFWRSISAKKYRAETRPLKRSIALIFFSLSQFTKQCFGKLNFDIRWKSLNILIGSPVETTMHIDGSCIDGNWWSHQGLQWEVHRGIVTLYRT